MRSINKKLSIFIRGSWFVVLSSWFLVRGNLAFLDYIELILSSSFSLNSLPVSKNKATSSS